MSQMAKQGEKVLHPYYLEGGILKKYVYNAKQQFKTMVIPGSLRGILLRLSHNDLGHNGTARTYMLVRQNYYWKGMRPEVTRYIKQCKLCRTHNSASTRYVKGTNGFYFHGPHREIQSFKYSGEQIRPHGNMYAVRLDLVHTHSG